MRNKKWRETGSRLIVLAALAITVCTVVVMLRQSGIEDGSHSGNSEASQVLSSLPPASVSSDTGTPEAPEMDNPETETFEPDVSETVKPATEIREPEITDISARDTELAKRLDAAAKAYGCIAVSLTVFEGESNFTTYQYGYADVGEQRVVNADTKFRIASLSKLTTAICAMTLADAGQIDLDADISAYLGYDAGNPNYPETPITCRMLMQHTSSIYDSDAFLSSRNAYSSKSTRQLLDAGSSYKKREPGTRHEYSNFGTAVLGAVCEMVSEKPLDTLAREVLLDPLGIDAAYIPANLRDTGNIAAIYNENHVLTRSVVDQLVSRESGELGRDQHLAQGGLTISSLDYAKILAMLANGGTFGGVRILSAEAVREIHGADFAVDPYMQGLVVRYQADAFEGEGVYWHTGSNYGTFAQFIYNYETGRGVVVITTGAAPSREANGMVKVCTALSGIVWESSARPLEGMVVCVDPGHQGKGNSGQEVIAPGVSETKPKVASGTTGSFTKIPEYVLTLEVGLMLREKLESLGAVVVMTRTTHDVDISNRERALLANENGCDMVVRIHADGSADSGVSGYSVLVPGEKYTPGIVAESRRMAELLDSVLGERVTIPSRGIITRDDLTGFNWLEVPGVLLEMGYMTNRTDDETMQTPEFKEAVVDAVAEALMRYRSEG